MKPILVVGSINMDFFVRMPRMPKAGESMVVEGIKRSLGGKGANQALAAVKLGHPVEYVGMVGSDENGLFLRNKLNEYGLNAEHLLVTPEASTGMAIILVEDDGENRIIVDKGANNKLHMAHLEGLLAPDKYSAVLLQLEIPLETVASIIKESHRLNLRVIVDAGPAIKCDLNIFHGVDVLTPNQPELETLTGKAVSSLPEAKEACAFLKAKAKVNRIVLKMGSMGALVYENDEFVFMDAYKVTARDTTGAGDSFTAALATRLALGWNLVDAVAYANAVGALTVTKDGIYEAIPTFHEVEEFLQAF